MEIKPLARADRNRWRVELISACNWSAWLTVLAALVASVATVLGVDLRTKAARARLTARENNKLFFALLYHLGSRQRTSGRPRQAVETMHARAASCPEPRAKSELASDKSTAGHSMARFDFRAARGPPAKLTITQIKSGAGRAARRRPPRVRQRNDLAPRFNSHAYLSRWRWRWLGVGARTS